MEAFIAGRRTSCDVFFFQAEDGIRDLYVTGVQTCALPISWYRKHGSTPKIAAFVEGVTAAAIGAITGAVYVIGGGEIRDVPTALIALGSLLVLIYTKLPEPLLVCAA